MNKINVIEPQIVLESEESLKQLREVILNNKDIKTVEMCSALSKEGTTYMSIGLAVSLAKIDKKVLLLDCDLRASKLNQILGVKEDIVGISDNLLASEELTRYQTNIANLDVVFAGKHSNHSIELLRKQSFIDGLDKLKDEYDYIIVDTPSVKRGVDVYTVANYVDAAAIVVRCDYANIDVVQATKTGLERTGVDILGVVFNQVKWYHKDYYIYSHK